MTSSVSRRRTTLGIAIGAASALCLGLLTGCSDDSDSGTGADGKPVTLTFWGWAKGTKEVVDAFNASHKDIKVSYKEIPSGVAGGYAKISNAVKAGNAPDLFNVEYPQLPDFVSQGAVKDISDQVDPALEGQYLPQAIDLVTLGGAKWALPLDASPQTFYYRKDLFEKAGIKTPPKTWDEFRTDAEKIKKADPKSRIATFFPDDPSTFEAMVWQAGGRWFKAGEKAWDVNFDDNATRETAAYWQKMIDDDLVHVTPSFSQQWTNSLQKGRTAGYLGAAWGGGVLGTTLPDQKGKWAAAPMPTADGKPASGMLGGTTFAVSKDSEKTEAAVEFAKWATTTEAGIKARIATGTSSAYPAAPALVPVARKAFKTDFLGGQDVYADYEDAARSINEDWTWGPVMGVTNNALRDSFAKLGSGDGDILGSVRKAQQDTRSELKNRGIEVSGR
ncbi:sugar ABC transporter substrate-binding protein [Streptomyces sp. NA04227]|uniref:ABC transporter substrate-binding protein n=1 Tax=Streptomyces sp. NA04227 TaxID=2742136 RepID=UPI001591C1BE|nr:sugar ABC transporter substrate-binding protein [Streptomyces sp. NA04227]QKW09772.1 sugar ABC transporter substrate-binding protein [Streptomyces sp. NA04227]